MLKYTTVLILFLLIGNVNAQTNISTTQPQNIYKIKQQFLEQVLHNPAEKDLKGDDNDLQKFNRWFNLVEPRCFPSGNLPSPDILLKEYQHAKTTNRTANKTTTVTSTWTSLGPSGMGRIDCIVIDPIDTNKLYVGAACGGVWISHDRGITWVNNCDTFPSLSVGDIAVNPHHTDTLYAATGDSYGYEAYYNFWGGLYTGGVLKSTDGGNSWHTTGLSYMQTNNDIIQKLIIHPNNPNILLAATRNGIFRTTDAGATWNMVSGGHVFSIAFRPQQPDTIYAINTSDLIVSYNAGLTWSILHPSINSSGDRCSIATSVASPRSIWVLNDSNNLMVSHNEGNTFRYLTSPSATITFYGYYDRVLSVSPADTNYIIAAGMQMGVSTNGGNSWNLLDPMYNVHVDNHVITFNPQHPATIYSGNDGGIFVTGDLGGSWTDLSSGLTISQIYRMSSSRQNPYVMLCGLQDNCTLYNDGTVWNYSNAPCGDGMDCLIYPGNDNIQVTSYQYGQFALSIDHGATYNSLTAPQSGYWTTPAVFSPNGPDTMYFGYNDIFASYDMGATYTHLTIDTPFAPIGAFSLAISQSNSSVLYCSGFSKMLRSTDRGASWTDVTGSLLVSTSAITYIAVDYTNPMNVYVTVSGYTAGQKVYFSSTGGTTWTNISGGLPNLPADCIALDSSTPGAMFVGTDIGVYYKDNSLSDWILYNTGLPNVIVDHLEINYTNYRLRAATYGRGVWETKLQKSPLQVPSINAMNNLVKITPNPTKNSWKLMFSTQKPNNYTVKVYDMSGRNINTYLNTDIIDAHTLPQGVYTIEIITSNEHYNLKAVRN